METEREVPVTTQPTKEALVMNDYGFVIKQPRKAPKKASPSAAKAPRAARAPKAPKAPRVTKMSRAIEVFRANKGAPLKDVQAKIAAELGLTLERAYGYVRTIVNDKLVD